MSKIGFLKPGSYPCQPFRRNNNSKLTHLTLVVKEGEFTMVEIDSIHDDLVEISYREGKNLYRGKQRYKLSHSNLSLRVKASQMIIDERFESLKLVYGSRINYSSYIYKNPTTGLYEEFYNRNPTIDYIRTFEANFEKIYLNEASNMTLEDLILAEEDDIKSNVILKEISKMTGIKIGKFYDENYNGSLSGNILEIRGAFVTNVAVKDVEEFKTKFKALCMEHSLFPQVDITFNVSYLEDNIELSVPELYCIALNQGIDLKELFKRQRGVLIGDKFGL
jgi:hypothetical protein